jgi:hypothetical protein
MKTLILTVLENKDEHLYERISQCLYIQNLDDTKFKLKFPVDSKANEIFNETLEVEHKGMFEKYRNI